jgi:hypothetical protein
LFNFDSAADVYGDSMGGRNLGKPFAINISGDNGCAIGAEAFGSSPSQAAGSAGD